MIEAYCKWGLWFSGWVINSSLNFIFVCLIVWLLELPWLCKSVSLCVILCCLLNAVEIHVCLLLCFCMIRSKGWLPCCGRKSGPGSRILFDFSVFWALPRNSFSSAFSVRLCFSVILVVLWRFRAVQRAQRRQMFCGLVCWDQSGLLRPVRFSSGSVQFRFSFGFSACCYLLCFCAFLCGCGD